MSARLRIVPVVAGLILSAAACGGGDGSSSICLEGGGDGKVCAVPTESSVRFTSHGLQPGSRVEIVSTTEGNQSWPVGDDGAIEGTVAFLSARPRGWEFDIAATAADGTMITGQVTIPAPEG